MNLRSAMPLGFDTTVYCVPAGTEIEHEGERMTVTETVIVWLGNKVYCTKSFFNTIKEKTAKRLS